jgi:hypothetical protein
LIVQHQVNTMHDKNNIAIRHIGKGSALGGAYGKKFRPSKEQKNIMDTISCFIGPCK